MSRSAFKITPGWLTILPSPIHKVKTKLSSSPTGPLSQLYHVATLSDQPLSLEGTPLARKTDSWGTEEKSLCVCVCVCVHAQLCWTLLQPNGLLPTRLFYPWKYPGKNNGVGSHFLLQGIFPTQELNQSLLHLCIGRRIVHDCTIRKVVMCLEIYSLLYRRKVHIFFSSVRTFGQNSELYTIKCVNLELKALNCVFCMLKPHWSNSNLDENTPIFWFLLCVI